MSFEDKLSSYAALRVEEMTEKYRDVIEDVLSTTTLSNLNVLVQFILNEQNRIPNAVAKACLSHLAVALSPIKSHEMREIAEFAVTEIKSNAASFDEPDFNLREALFGYFVGHGMWTEGAEVLGGSNLDSLDLSDHKKADVFIKCAEAYLEDNAGYDAETFVNKASSLIKAKEVSDDWELQLRYRVVFARVLDSNKKFNDAALRYYHLSNTEGDLEVEEDDLLDLYGKAMACAVLGKIGPQRTRVMELLKKDPRFYFLGQTKPKYKPHTSLLQKMCAGCLIPPNEMKEFSDALPPHQCAGAGTGFTLPEQAVMEHNLYVAGNVYDNISVKELGKLLSLDEVTTERVTCRMIADGKLKATLHQADGFLYFNQSSVGGDVNQNQNTDTALEDFGKRIARLCEEVNGCIDIIETSRSTEGLLQASS